VTGTPLTGASNAGEVGKKRDSGRITGCIEHNLLCVLVPYLVGVALRMSDVSGACVNIDIGIRNYECI